MRRVAEHISRLVESTLGDETFTTAGMFTVPSGPRERPPHKLGRQQRK
jgi:hypothetical protein